MRRTKEEGSLRKADENSKSLLAHAQAFLRKSNTYIGKRHEENAEVIRRHERTRMENATEVAVAVAPSEMEKRANSVRKKGSACALWRTRSTSALRARDRRARNRDGSDCAPRA